MRNAISILVCSLMALACLNGCNEPSGNKPASSNVFPPGIAGTWQGEDGIWKIVLSKDGKLESAVVAPIAGGTEIRPNETTTFEMKDGKMSHVIPGDCIVNYNPATRELSVSIEIKEIYISMGDDALTGNTLDIFKGPVSWDGKTWKAEWTNVFDYGPRFPQDENDVIGGIKTVVFRKIKEKPKTADSNTPH
jgi:hypothetical protein